MILDFSKCKTVKDVDEVFDKNFKETKTLHHLLKLIKKCLDAVKEIKNKEIKKQINKENQ